MKRSTKLKLSIGLFVVLLAFHVTVTNNYEGQYEQGDLSNLDTATTALGFATVMAFLWMITNFIKSYNEESDNLENKYYEEHDNHLGI